MMTIKRAGFLCLISLLGLGGCATISVIARKPGKENVVNLRGDRLTFAPGKLSMSVARSGMKSGELAREIGKLLSETCAAFCQHLLHLVEELNDVLDKDQMPARLERL